ncbi:MAG: 50S ribosomal protein L23 [Gammaproteobacteria bacterium]|nr:50S ribosomal protein L23 [Gammaproteobacteria bacterium]MBP9728517.1 50S ribosomal protein L23 [Gammaproteobacteria bacterium]
MNEKRLYSIILGPHVTEKSVRLAGSANQVVFKVAKDATKLELAEAVAKLFSVKVLSVQMLNVRGKVKNFKQVAGQRSHWKKAYVQLAAGHTINIESFQ